MGFLKFLKKSKEDKLEMPFEEDLDMPPPPPMSSKEQFLPMPDFELKPFSIPQEKTPNPLDLEPMEPEIPEEISKPPEPRLPRLEEKVKIIHPSRSQMSMHKERHISHLERMEREAVREEKRVLRHEAAPLKPIYMGVENFKEIKRSSGIIRNDLRNADEVLAKLQAMKGDKDKEFSKWQKTMEDIQKKIIFIDKTLFKGD